MIACIEVLELLTEYRVRLTWPNGRETVIGNDWPTRRIALAQAEAFIRKYGPI